uniref:Uncharacterized protein n=1 Tax=Ditylenchus dipsaci TaxID=166011 RepID=A0A915E7J5_9BILA
MTCSAPPLTLAPDASIGSVFVHPAPRLLSKLAYQSTHGLESSATNPIPSPPVPASPIAVTTELWLPTSTDYLHKSSVFAPPRLQCPYPTIKLQFASRTPNVPQIFVPDNSNNTCSRLNPSHSNTPTYRSINSECMALTAALVVPFAATQCACLWMGQLSPKAAANNAL